MIVGGIIASISIDGRTFDVPAEEIREHMPMRIVHERKGWSITVRLKSSRRKARRFFVALALTARCKRRKRRRFRG